MKRVNAGSHLPTPWLFQSAKRREPTTALAAVSSPSANTRYSIFTGGCTCGVHPIVDIYGR